MNWGTLAYCLTQTNNNNIVLNGIIIIPFLFATILDCLHVFIAIAIEICNKLLKTCEWKHTQSSSSEDDKNNGPLGAGVGEIPMASTNKGRKKNENYIGCVMMFSVVEPSYWALPTRIYVNHVL